VAKKMLDMMIHPFYFLQLNSSFYNVLRDMQQIRSGRRCEGAGDEGVLSVSVIDVDGVKMMGKCR